MDFMKEKYITKALQKVKHPSEKVYIITIS